MKSIGVLLAVSAILLSFMLGYHAGESKVLEDLSAGRLIVYTAVWGAATLGRVK